MAANWASVDDACGVGQLQKLLADHGHDAQQLMAMLAKSKTTFPVLSGSQTTPRWLYGLTAIGEQDLKNVEKLSISVSSHAKKALESLTIQANKVTALTFDSIDALGRYGCSQRKSSQNTCPVADKCPVAMFCKYRPISAI